jgi:hypothetical protein
VAFIPETSQRSAGKQLPGKEREDGWPITYSKHLIARLVVRRTRSQQQPGAPHGRSLVIAILEGLRL